MLNGKFYTGLPPKMEGRQCGNGQNRQESHFFWPDDTRVDSALETRVKRRNSLQLESGTDRPRLTAGKRLSTVRDEPGPDTRQMFHKEFAQSSIQFYDNLQPSQGNTNTGNRSRLLNRMRREVTPKLTDVEPVPAAVAAEAVPEVDPSAARRQQAYSSKIQFYDYVNANESDATQNNIRRPKMDMNNKREMELNSKNSPKLQVKHNVRHLSVERDQLAPSPPPLRMVTKKPLNDGPNWQQDQVEPIRRPPIKKILKQQPWIEDYDEGGLSYLDNGMQQMRLRNPGPSKKHVTYNEEAAEYAYYDDRPEPAQGRQPRQPLPNMRTGSGQQQQQQHRQQSDPYGETSRHTKSLNNYNKSSHNNYSEFNNNNIYDTYNNISNNNNISTRSRKILPKLPELTTTIKSESIRARRSDDTRATSAGSAATVAALDTTGAAAVEATSPSDPRKHLRSSLCFNGDALVVDVGAAPQSTSAVALARRSSAGQRVSVGLPD